MPAEHNSGRIPEGNPQTVLKNFVKELLNKFLQ